jgi:hypothetical protein
MKIDWKSFKRACLLESMNFNILHEQENKEINLHEIFKWLESNVDEFVIDPWIDVTIKKPDYFEQVLGYFPNGDESGNKVATAIMRDTLQSDFPNSTASYFEATHWMPIPKR